MNDIFRDVDEALKQEKVAEFWKKNGSLIIALIILIIAGTAVYSGYKSWTHSAQEQNTSQLIAFSKGTDYLYATSWGPDQKALAMLIEAQNTLAQDGDEDTVKNNTIKAFQLYTDISKDTAIDLQIRGLAAYYARNMMLNDQFKGVMEEEIVKPDGTIWSGYYKLQNALDLGTKQHDYPKALAILDEILNDQASDTLLKEQAEQVKYIYSYDLKKYEGTSVNATN